MTYLLAFVLFIALVVLMALGVMFSGKPIKGSCGGLATVGVERECNCEDVCDEHRRQLYQIQEPKA
ncbi:(Na+)-NQR maturation NqrM [Vibrio sinensis]|uniref:(Na+)-NQR maturation NqrM n=1 Tax=Vibrio sinensis TaxID=2302434 RepID=A0A3A6R8Q1_9VIBR|nr:(Na+)-NQR maturation NqrM [Vibrio sinensis]RJX72901.1 (Na+)-NQR maturation NqrM [Vibrio sinensis]